MPLSYFFNRLHGSLTGSSAPPQPPKQAPGHIASSLGLGASFAATLGALSSTNLGSSFKLLVLGSLVEVGRRLFKWMIERFGLQYSTTVRFIQGDPAYEWIVLLLTQENVWRRSREFIVSARNSQRKWTVPAAADTNAKANAEFVPTYKQPHLFRWRGYWVEIKRQGGNAGSNPAMAYYVGNHGGEAGSISMTVYTLDMNVLSDLVEDARLRYLDINRPNVVIHLADPQHHFGPGGATWTTVKHKTRRDLNSIILPDGVLDSMLNDAREFLNTENWYIEAGIPHRRGYLLHGPPGAGKTSTIYALAGALNLEIYSLSLASNFVDDGFLQRAASSIPKNGLLLIEDIDCAFPVAREDDEDEDLSGGGADAMSAAMRMMQGGQPQRRSRQSAVTLSGLLNVIDGVGSEEGKLFFATTNYIDRLDAALLRPGRIDRKIEYSLATAPQARALYLRFFPSARFAAFPETQLEELASEFAKSVPEGEFSTAELQGFLQGYKTRPVDAAGGVGEWIEGVKTEKREAERRREERREKARAKRQRAMNGNANANANGNVGAPPGSLAAALGVPNGHQDLEEESGTHTPPLKTNGFTFG
ncbi:P-loop containing nucleoside triphosphate hydrolase protein [Roridomyces roridus]|uniref:P-loop containing nucleoside triphosphate hydrolase protein n=1 Tax=Roridomyces roridus TaxID=1738132 RepID=A0AAD7F5L3_9AGAR|nr:P-loop containing nucleoside triphosphate hydrolase protein [Roridomyces roridus]